MTVYVFKTKTAPSKTRLQQYNDGIKLHDMLHDTKLHDDGCDRFLGALIHELRDILCDTEPLGHFNIRSID